MGAHAARRYFILFVSSRLLLWTRPADIVMWKLLLCVFLEGFEWTLSHVVDRKNSNQRPFGWSAWRKPSPACHQWCEELWWMVNLREPDWKCTFHCCLPGPHQHEQFVQIYLRAVKSSAKTLSSFCTAVEPRALPLILSDKLWNKTRSSTHSSGNRSKRASVYPAVQILTPRHHFCPFPPHSYEENKETEMLLHVIVRRWSLISKLLELFDALQSKTEP